MTHLQNAPEPPTTTDVAIVAVAGIGVVLIALAFTAAFILARRLDRRDRQRLADHWREEAVRQHHTATTLKAADDPTVKVGGHAARGRAEQLDDCAHDLLALEEK